MSSQHMYYYQNGKNTTLTLFPEISCYDDRATPPGIFTLYYKKSLDVLVERRSGYTTARKPRLSTVMPFNGGIGFHDATWQAYFGGESLYPPIWQMASICQATAVTVTALLINKKRQKFLTLKEITFI